MTFKPIFELAPAGQILGFTDRAGKQWRVTRYVTDEQDARAGAVRCPIEKT